MSEDTLLREPVVKSIEKEGNRVKISLNQPFALMLDALAQGYSAVYSEKYIEKHGDMKTTAMGTGPFKFKSYTHAVSLKGVKNPDFWVKGRAYLDGYRVLMLRDKAINQAHQPWGKGGTCQPGWL